MEKKDLSALDSTLQHPAGKYKMGASSERDGESERERSQVGVRGTLGKEERWAHGGKDTILEAEAS